MKTLIFVPFYNCEKQISRVVGLVDKLLLDSDINDYISQVLFLDNCSTDKSIESALLAIKNCKSSNKIRVAKNKANYGLGGSHKSAALYATAGTYTHLAIIHGDNQANALELKSLILHSLKQNMCSVLGSRFSDLNNLKNYSFLRKIGNILLNRTYSLILKSKIEDLGSGLNLINLNQLDMKKMICFDDEFTFNMDLLIYLVAHSKKISYFPITWKCEDEVSNARAMNVGLSSLIKIIKWTFFKEKIWKNKSTSYYFQEL
jgi:glycosyltransferase involved in cell wall biosynthesis